MRSGVFPLPLSCFVEDAKQKRRMRILDESWSTKWFPSLSCLNSHSARTRSCTQSSEAPPFITICRHKGLINNATAVVIHLPYSRMGPKWLPATQSHPLLLLLLVGFSMEVNLCHWILKIKSHWILSTEYLCIEIKYLDFSASEFNSIKHIQLYFSMLKNSKSNIQR